MPDSARINAKAFFASALALFAILLAVIGLWFVMLHLNPPPGLSRDAMLAAVPMLLLTLGIVWLALRFGMRRSVDWKPPSVLAGAFGFGVIAVVSMCGPAACFVAGPNRFLGWFVVGGITVAAWAHHIVYVRVTGGDTPWQSGI